MSTMQSGKKRRVSTCIACYNRKQKCNRRYPCNHCTRRRRPEECVYTNSSTTRSSSALPLVDGEQSQACENSSDFYGNDAANASDGAACSTLGQLNVLEEETYGERTALLESFAYAEDSNCNTMALLKRWDPNWNSAPDMHFSKKQMPRNLVDSAQRGLSRLPPRQIIDFLIQYFIAELNWFKQLVHAPSFLMEYQQWWDKEQSHAVEDVEFAALVLRICSYAAQFLPSPSHTIDKIAKWSLPDIRSICSDIGDSLAKLCLAADWRGSLVRVQHCLFATIKFSCEGRTDQFWEGVADACQAAQKAGIHRDILETLHDPGWEIEKEMRRRVFCCLYVLDSHLARQLDRVPFLPDNLVSETLPKMHLVPESNAVEALSGAPETFTERLMQVQLNRFWRSFGGRRNSDYDPTQAEERYERFITEFISTIPPSFALEPDTTWDQHLPKLNMQRQLLHISIFDSVCWNFRPLLLLKQHQVESLPQYKQVLLQSQRKVLATVALKELEAIATLHFLFNDSHTRFGVIIFNTFEASVLLLWLCMQPDFPPDEDSKPCGPAHILGHSVGRLTRQRMMQAAEKGLERLQMLAEVNEMAVSGARTLGHIVTKASRSFESPTSAISSHPSWSSDRSAFPDLMTFDYDSGYSASSMPSNSGFGSGPLSMMQADDTYSGLQLSSLDFASPYTINMN